jgi:tetratricopeptide (TPR) repeat protein
MSPTSKPTGAIEVFYSYAHEDNQLRKQLEKHLSILKRQGLITDWYDREINAGTDWEREIDRHLNTAQIILLLVSADFMASDYCYGLEMKRALERHESGEARVIPIILRPTDWKQAPFGKLQVLPRDGKPMTRWPDLDEAFLDITQGIRNIVKELTVRPVASKSLSTSNILADLSTEPASPSVWNVPYRRDKLFTGREDVLKYLYETFTRGKAGTFKLPLALTGLEGIGKTQIAVEYAYRHNRNYQAVLWARADSHTKLISDFLAIASLLNLPEKDTQDQSFTVTAVKRWLEMNADWLLVLDNADDQAITFDFLPSEGKGHILLTTRNQAMGTFAGVEIEKMKLEEGALFLLHRGRIIAPDAPIDAASAADRAVARDLVQILAGLPLALDQAGAYIGETQCSLSSYLDLYHKHSAKLLKGRGGVALDHPEPVATTWASSFKRVEQVNPAAADLLQFCAFLSPDGIPEEIITEGAPELGPRLQLVAADSYKLNFAIEELLQYSLLRRNSEAKTLTIHRLVQAVLKDTMDEDTQHQWAKRTVRAVSRVFPKAEYTTWSLCQRYLPHAQVCAALIEQWDMVIPEAVHLLNQAAYYLKQRAQYAQAEPLYQRALAIDEKTLGPEHPEVATDLSNLAMLYYEQGKYTQAEPLYQRVLAIDEKTLGPEHPSTASCLNNLAMLYHEQGKYTQAEPLYQRALTIREKVFGLEHPQVATSLNNLATLYSYQDKYDTAEPLFTQALAIDEKIYGLSHPNVARDFNNLGGVLEARGDLSRAQVCYEQALHIDEKTYGPNHPNVAVDFNNLGSALRKLGNLSEAQVLYERALYIDEKAYGPEHPNVAIRLNNLSVVLREQGKLEEAKALYERALAIVESAYGPNHPNLGNIVNNLASVLQTMGDLTRAQALYEKALKIVQATYGPNHPNVGIIVYNLASVLEEKGDIAGSQAYYKQAYQIFREDLGENHPYVARVAENLSNTTGDSR